MPLNAKSRPNRGPESKDYLDPTEGAERTALFRELLAIELEFRRAHGNLESEQEYARRFPRYAEHVRQVFAELATDDGEDIVSVMFGQLTSTLTLRPYPNLADIPVDALESAFQEEEFAPGDVLLRQGEAARSLMLICEGSVEISTTDPNGNEYVIDRAEPGQILGEMALLTNQPRSANATAITSVRTKIVQADQFHQLARRYPNLSVALTHLVAKRLGKPGRDALTDKVLDHFRIKRRLGRGGMGVVYEAEDGFRWGTRRAKDDESPLGLRYGCIGEFSERG